MHVVLALALDTLCRFNLHAFWLLKTSQIMIKIGTKKHSKIVGPFCINFGSLWALFWIPFEPLLANLNRMQNYVDCTWALERLLEVLYGLSQGFLEPTPALSKASGSTQRNHLESILPPSNSL